jgi:hypothetical protein
MVAATALKLWHRVHIQWHDLPTECHKNVPAGSEVDGGTDRMVMSLAYFFPLGKKVG